MADSLQQGEIMTTIDLELLAQAHGGAGPFAAPAAPRTVGEMFPEKGTIPYGQWTTWGSKTAGHPAPPLGDANGIRYTFWGRPGRDAIVLSGPHF